MSTDIEDIGKKNTVKLTIDQRNELIQIPKLTNSSQEERQLKLLQILLKMHYLSKENFSTVFDVFARKCKLSVNKERIREIYNDLSLKNRIEPNPQFERYCISQSSQSHSGVSVITVMMAPENHFINPDGSAKGSKTCAFNCSFCPVASGITRSYPAEEPVPSLSRMNEHDPARVVHSRLTSLSTHGHMDNKVELIIVGGTWSTYEIDYRIWFHTTMFFAANLWSEGININRIQSELKSQNRECPPDAWRGMVREMLPIEEEMERNRKGNCRIIGLTVETRPDQISPKELRLIRSLGSTRIQFGVQSSDNDVLNRNNRKCSIERAMRGLKTAVVNGFKIDCHWMPDLPGSNPEIDRKILDDAVRNPNLRADQLKIYPCQVLNDTLIYEWYTKGEYKPYAETEEGFQQLIDILLEFKQKLPPWIRTNRIVRDFPKAIIRGGLNVTHLNDVLLKLLAKKGLRCKCIRCREIKRNEFEMNDVKLLVRKYRSYDGDEYFISFELFEDEDVSTLAEFTEYDEFNNPTNPNFKDGKWILGFCRLRLNGESKANFPELENRALIRELHVYGTTTDIGQHSSYSVQHRGFGKRMMKKAEEIAKENGWNKMAVIAGIGTQDYYAKLGYDDGFYMTKNL